MQKRKTLFWKSLHVIIHSNKLLLDLFIWDVPIQNGKRINANNLRISKSCEENTSITLVIAINFVKYIR